MSEDDRVAPRRRVLKAGLLSFGGDAIDCSVRNLSATGAALEVVTPMYIPDRFKLIVQSENLNQSCHVVWRRRRRIGVAFDIIEQVVNRNGKDLFGESAS
jgi:hypothetical protein